ncbi:hypothetical protein BGE01nite_06820 [Brevifollis gellanilyticus]|uniref:Uncharacterized protein n=1 Tax=Brevifollis gellanilyticus TaxID=748831 RepID=A0A512M4W0_9BACT|nr:hypothetical protein BGE01nite_06820 [Brevifollis gellanilyticus]
MAGEALFLKQGPDPAHKERLRVFPVQGGSGQEGEEKGWAAHGWEAEGETQWEAIRFPVSAREVPEF